MIASVSGEVLHKSLDHVVIEAAGVGYMLSVSANTLEDVGPAGAKATLLATLVVREDAMQLYGFSTAEERDVFNLLTSVSGVGPKVGLAVLSGMTVPEVETALVAGDHESFQKVPGIGKRTAERLVVELKDKIVPSGAPTVLRAAGRADDPGLLARDGLLGLGYSLAQAEAMLAEASGETTEDLIASALRGVAV
ncbi:MAG: Holliday junction branch migration protein RuvA [Thermoleophilaceae bacterium]|nr:Holliday junction branch migration protein RuvA [Thermoleophilaceae bacterium]